MRAIARRLTTVLSVSALALTLLLPTAAWAPHVAQLIVEPTQVEPGGEVMVEGQRGFGREFPVEIRFDALDGPVLATIETDEQFFAAFDPQPVRIPSDVEPGTYLLYATQELGEGDGHIRGVPARAVIQVVGEGGSPAFSQPLAAPVEGRPANLAVEEGLDLGTLGLIALGVAGVALVAAAAVALVASRRGQPATQKVDNR